VAEALSVELPRLTARSAMTVICALRSAHCVVFRTAAIPQAVTGARTRLGLTLSLPFAPRQVHSERSVRGPGRALSTGPHRSRGNISAQKSGSPLIDAAPPDPPARVARPTPQATTDGRESSPWRGNRGSLMDIESYDRRTDRDAEHRFATESAFISAAEDLLRSGGRGFVSATLPDGAIVPDERALRVLIAASAVAS
jgi:hypothetical protein